MRRSTSSIDTNELTDMDRKEDMTGQEEIAGDTFASNMLINAIELPDQEESRNQYPTFAK